VTTGSRIVLTVALGIVLGLVTWLGMDGYSPSQGVEEIVGSPPLQVAILAFFIFVPLAVGRWWVVASLVGRFAALAILELTGHMFHNTDGWEKPLGSLSILGIFLFGLVMLALVGLRKVFDVWRGRRAIPSP
jgi:hypothetical protein